MENELKISEEKIRKDLITEMIVEKLFSCLKKTSKGTIRLDYYKINEDDFTYLLEKYDNVKFNEYKEMLLTNKEEE